MDFDALKKPIAKLAETHNLDVVAVFGSQATDRVHSKSDVDIAVLSHAPVNRARIAMELDSIFKRGYTEVVNLANASPTLMRQVVSEGRLLYEREQGLFFRWKIYAIKIWMETAWLRALGRKKLVEWAQHL